MKFVQSLLKHNFVIIRGAFLLEFEHSHPYWNVTVIKNYLKWKALIFLHRRKFYFAVETFPDSKHDTIRHKLILKLKNWSNVILEMLSYFISTLFFQLSLSAAKLFHELSFRCCLGVASYIFPSLYRETLESD